MSAGLTNNLLVRTLLSPELQNDAALEERVKKIDRVDRIKLMESLDAILAFSSPEIGIEIPLQLLLDDPEAPYVHEYNYSRLNPLEMTRARSNPKVMEKIKSVRKALIERKLPEDSQFLDPHTVRSALQGKINELTVELQGNYVIGLALARLDTLSSLEALIPELQAETDAYNKGRFTALADKIKSCLEKMSPQLSSLSRKDLPRDIKFLLAVLRCRYPSDLPVQLDFDDLVLDAQEQTLLQGRVDLPVFFLKALTAKLPRMRTELENNTAPAEKTIKKRDVFVKRLELYQNHVAKLRETSNLAKEVFKLERICFQIEKLQKPEIQNLEQVKVALAEVQRSLMACEDHVSFNLILDMLRLISDGSDLRKVLFDTLSELMKLYSKPPLPALQRIHAYSEMSFDVLKDEKQRFILIKDSIECLITILKNSKGSSELTKLEKRIGFGPVQPNTKGPVRPMTVAPERPGISPAPSPSAGKNLNK